MRLFDKPWMKSVVLALVIVGVAAIAYNVFQYVSLARAIEDNPAYRLRQSGQVENMESQVEVQMLAVADQNLRDLLQQRYVAMFGIGTGIALISLGWIGSDIIRTRRRNALAAPEQPAAL